MSDRTASPLIETSPRSYTSRQISSSPVNEDFDATGQSEEPSHTGGHSFRRQVVSGGRVHFGDSHQTINNYRVEAEPSRDDLHQNRVRFYLPPRRSTRYFTGRALQLQQTHLSLARSLTDRHDHKVIVIYGIGGAGKTQFCLRYCEEHRDRYRGIFWIDASSSGNAESSYADIGQLLGKGRSAKAGKYFLSTFPRPWLLIIDNADDPALDLSELLPSGNAGQILITTRNPGLASWSTVKPIRLANMDPEEAIDLLLRSAYPEDRESWSKPSYRPVAAQIAERLGYLAIAIHLAGSTIRKKICTIEKYLTYYLGQRGLLPGPSASLHQEEQDIITTWEIPFRTIEARQNTADQDAVVVLHILALLHHESIPEQILQAPMLTSYASDTDRQRLPSLYRDQCTNLDAAKARLRMALNVLYEYSIIDLDDAKSVCSLHPIVHEWARSRISATGKIEYWLDCTAFVLARSDEENEGIDGARPAQLIPHLDSFLHMLQVCKVDLIGTPNGINHMQSIAFIYERAGSWKKSLQILMPIIQYQSQKLGPRHEDTLVSKRRVSLCHWNLFEVSQAISLQLQITAARWVTRRSIVAWRNPIRPMHKEYLTSLSDLTQSLWLGGARRASQFTGERSVNGLTRQFGPQHLLTLEASFNLARTYRHLGILELAHTMLVDVVRERRRILGRRHVDTLMALNELGMNYKSRGKNLALAERLVRHVLTQREDILGSEHAYTLWSVNDLAKVLCVRDKSQEAIGRLELAIPAVSRTLGDQHVGMQMTKGNLALAYAQSGRWNEAEILLEDLISRFEKHHPDWLRSMIGCTRLHIRLQRFTEAKQKCDEMIALLTESEQPLYTSVIARVSRRDWAGLAQILAGWYVEDQKDRAKDLRVVTGLLYETYRQTDNHAGSEELMLNYPDLDVDAFAQPFELT